MNKNIYMKKLSKLFFFNVFIIPVLFSKNGCFKYLDFCKK